MARVLIIEPDAEIRALIGWVVRRLQLEPVDHDPSVEAGDVAAIVVEPDAAGGIEAARTVARATGAGVICLSICEPNEQAAGLDPVAHLLKPFALLELERAILAAATSSTSAAAA